MIIPKDRVRKISTTQNFPKDVLTDPRITREIGVLKCIQCGRCSAGCPAASIYDDFSPREMMRMLSLGELDELLKGEGIWRCSQCYTCHSRCPRNNSPATIVLVLRELAIRKGYATDRAKRVTRMLGRNIWEKGVTLSPDIINADFLSDFDDETKKHWEGLETVRKMIGYTDNSGRMKPLPERAIMEVRIILEKMKYMNIVDQAAKERGKDE